MTPQSHDNLSRRALLGSAAAVTLGAAMPASAQAPLAGGGVEPPAGGVAASTEAIAGVRKEYEALARDWVLNERLTRKDGYVYTVDWGQLLAYFALAGDREAYLRMREHTVRHLIINDPKDPLTQGFVQWRFKAGEAPHASGTTEMLRVAKALWRGARAFDRSEDADLVLFILRGYARHAAVDQGIWLIRNYYHLGDRHFATNSFLVDYDPDFVADVGRALADKPLQELADKCYGVYRQAVAPSGLIYDLVQPEIKTLVGRKDVLFYSPNDIMGLHNSVTCAEGVARGQPHIAKGVLAFALSRLPDLRAYYFGRTGEPVDQTPARLVEINSLLRLSTVAGGVIARQQLLRAALPLWREYLPYIKPTDAYTASEVLLTTQAVTEGKV